MKKIFLILTVFFITSSMFGQKTKARWQKERYSLGVISYTNTPIMNDDFGYGISLSTRILKFVSIETNLITNTAKLYGEGCLKVYPIPKKYVRKNTFSPWELTMRRVYTYGDISINTFKEIGIGFGFGYNINNKWRTELRFSNKTINQKIIFNPYFGIGIFRNLNFHEYPPKISSKY